MTDVITYLSNYREDTPEWIGRYLRGEQITFSDIMSSRVGYYPGSGYDGTLMKIGNKSRSVHSFLYVDYLISRSDLEKHLAQPKSIHGYHSVGKIEWTEADLLPNGQYPLTINKRPKFGPNTFVDPHEKPYCFTLIMERDSDQNKERGAKHFAITFLFADGIATYYQLFVREYAKAPWLFLLQDHGFGCNYDSFGRGGILAEIIQTSQCHPAFVLCADNTFIWKDFQKVPCVESLCDYFHNPRTLYAMSPLRHEKPVGQPTLTSQTSVILNNKNTE